MHKWFCPIHLVHLIGRKSLHFEKTRLFSPQESSRDPDATVILSQYERGYPYHFFWASHRKAKIMKSVRIDVIGTFWRATTLELYHITCIVFSHIKTKCTLDFTDCFTHQGITTLNFWFGLGFYFFNTQKL